MASVDGMSEVSAKSFLGLLQKSGICDTAELKATLSALSRNANGKPIRLDQLTGHLLEAGLISEWHVKKLLAGKYKGFFLGKYKLLRHLGTGGMSTVYVAQHTIFNQKRAIKVLPRDRIADKTFLERFYREGRAAASLNHKNIVRVYDIDHEGDTHYLVMEYAKGKDIYELVKKSGPLDFDKAIDYTVQALTGLQHAHDNELVHRDVKPANLLVTPEGDVKILDLGLALFQEDDSSLTVMHNERVLGTADYLSPEQAVDSHNLDHRADIYSTGCTLYYMLTGKPPFHEGTLAQRIARHQTCEPKNIRDFRSDCPDELVSIVAKMMKKNPDERFQSCNALAAVLRSAGESLLNQPTTNSQLAQRPPTPAAETNRTVEKAPKQKIRKRPVEKKVAAGPSGNSNDGSRKPNPTAKVKSGPTSISNSAVTKSGSPSTQNQLPKRQPATVARSNPADSGAKPESAPGKSENTKRASANPQSPDRQSATGKKLTEPGNNVEKQQRKPGPEPVRQKKTSEAKIPKGSKQPARGVPGKPNPNVKSTKVSVVVPATAAPKAAVGKQEFEQFVSHNRKSGRQSVRPTRKPVKNQLLVTGMVIGMLTLLGIALAIAVNMVSPDEDKKQGKSGERFVPNANRFEPSTVIGRIDRDLVKSENDSGSLFFG